MIIINLKDFNCFNFSTIYGKEDFFKLIVDDIKKLIEADILINKKINIIDKKFKNYVNNTTLMNILSNYVENSTLITILNNYQEKLINGINIKTINNNELLGAGNIEIQTENLHNYSTNEQVIGTFIDGRQSIYEKSFQLTNYTASTGNWRVIDEIDLTNLNIDTLISTFAIGNYQGYDVDYGMISTFGLRLSSDKSSLEVFAQYANTKINTITIQYTKTTDN